MFETISRRLLPALLIVGAAMVLVLASCAKPSVPLSAYTTPPVILVPAGKAGIRDDRGRFREIMCAIQRDHGARLPENRSCAGDSILWHLAGEPAPTGVPVALGPSTADIRLVLVPGLLAECVSQTSRIFEDGRANVESAGYKTTSLPTGGRLGSDRNAGAIYRAVLALRPGETLVFVTHSKGTVDVLEALVGHPDLAARVAAVVSVSGAVNGSPLADTFSHVLLRWAESVPLPSCPPGEGTEAVDSLRRATRLRFLADHPLPSTVRYYSLAAFASREDVSLVLQPFYDILARTDPLNDGLLNASDAIIPGSTLLGYPNADHLAVAMPFTQKHALLTTLNNKNSSPRAALLEAIARYVEEDLKGKKQETGG